MGEDGAPFLDKSKPIAYVINGRSWVNNHAHVLRANAALTAAAFLKYFLDWFEFDGYVTGSTRLKLTQGAMRSIPVTLPPLVQQQRIVAKIEELIARVNASRKHLARVPTILKRFRQSVLAAACSGRLTEDWRDAQDLGGESQNGALPAGWTEHEFGDVTENHDGKRIPIKETERAKRRGKYRYYGASGPIDWIDDYLFDGRFLLVGEDGANLLARSTPIAFIAEGRFWVNNHAHVVQAKPAVSLDYLALFLNQLDLQTIVTGSAQPKLTQRALNQIPVGLPQLAEQHEIVRRVEALFALGDHTEKCVAAATVRADRLTQSILAKAFRGDLVPTDAELARQAAQARER